MQQPRRHFLGGLALALVLDLACAGAGFAQRATPLPAEATWPHSTTIRGTTFTVSEPQAISWSDHRVLTARAALSVLRLGARVPILGTVEVTANTETDYTTRSVTYFDVKLVSTKFPQLDTAQAAQLEQEIRDLLPSMGARRVPLDAVLLSLKTPPSQPRNVALNSQPPAIFYSARPASLVVFNGEPILTDVQGANLKFAVNTNWNVFNDPAGNMWYLLDNGEWLMAPAATGPWTAARSLPAVFNSIPGDKSYADVKKALPLKPAKPDTTPAIFVSMKPAEIIVTDGAPKMAPLAGTGLQYVTNTPTDLFFVQASGRFYFLTSGRWFSAANLQGPWVFATTDLPPDFAKIPPDSAKGHVLASVPGTPQAQEAVMQAQVPRQGTLTRSTVSVTVTYAGDPLFKPIPATTLTYAVNTPYQVISVNGKYYVCYQAAWFVGPGPNGPWVLADAIPAEIYTIPPDNPLYNVTYVTVYSSTPTTVTYGYTTGYTLGYVSAGVVVYGTGYYYPPYYYPAPIPVFYPYPYSYAGATWYNPTTGAWARGGTIYGPYGGAASGARYYNPTTGSWAKGGAIYGPNGGADAWSYYNAKTGTYAHGSASWGPDGGTGHASFSNPTTGRSGSTTQNWNQYERWGSSTVSGPNQTVNNKSASNAQGRAGGFSSSSGAEGAGVSGAGGNRAGAVKTAGGDTYAGADGNVYKNTGNGWEKYDNGSWNPVTPPDNSRSQTSQGQSTSGGSQGQGQRAQSAQQSSSASQGQRAQSAQQSRQQSGASSSGQSMGQTQSRASRASGGEQMSRENYGQLEQDRFARNEGAARQQQFGAMRGGFAGGGGGRFRR
jgi:hypothetical protein